METNPLTIIIPTLTTDEKPTVLDLQIFHQEGPRFISPKTLIVEEMDQSVEKGIIPDHRQD